MRIDFKSSASPYLAIALAFTVALPAHAQLTVDEDLGTVTTGSTIMLTGNSSDTGRQVQTYPGAAFSTLIFGEETVYEFDIATPFQLEATFDPRGLAGIVGHDIIVLDGLASGVSSVGLTAALDAVERINFSGVTETLRSNAFRPGTYYLSVSTQGGIASGGPPESFLGPDGGLFDFDLSFLTLPLVTPPPAIDLGVIALAGQEFELDTENSGVSDTELGLYDSEGFLIAENDDASGLGGRSRISLESGLPEGTYYVAAGEFNTIFGFGFDAGMAPRELGITLNINGQTTEGLLPSAPTDGEPVWFSFQVAAVPEPATATMLIFAAAFVHGARSRSPSARR